ncbi:MAG: AMMECR1 domain-containing protein [Halodesulfurarchaeum sp.]
MSRGRAERLTAADGTRAVELARDAVRKFVDHGRREDPGSMRDSFYTRAGAFVRLETADGRGQLRGAASVPARPSALPEKGNRLGHAIVEAAIKAASDTSRGAVSGAELSNLYVSLFVLREGQSVADPREDVELGTHGVALERGDHVAWMYPTVPVRQGWSIAECLDRTAIKAGLGRGGWEADDVQVTRLGGPVFEERDSEGDVERKMG